MIRDLRKPPPCRRCCQHHPTAHFCDRSGMASLRLVAHTRRTIRRQRRIGYLRSPEKRTLQQGCNWVAGTSTDYVTSAHNTHRLHQHTTACLTTQHKPNCCTPTAKVLAPCLGHPMHGSAHIIVIITFCAYPRSPKPSHDMPAVSLCKKHGICLRIGQATTRPTRSMYQPTFRPGRLKPKKTTMLCSDVKRCCQPPRTITLLISFPGGTAHHGQQPQLVLPVQEGSAPTAHSPGDTC